MLKKISDAIVIELRELFSTTTELPEYKNLNARLIKKLSIKAASASADEFSL